MTTSSYRCDEYDYLLIAIHTNLLNDERCSCTFHEYSRVLVLNTSFPEKENAVRMTAGAAGSNLNIYPRSASKITCRAATIRHGYPEVDVLVATGIRKEGCTG